MKRISMLVAVGTLMTIGGCSENVVDKPAGQQGEIAAPVIETPSPLDESPANPPAETVTPPPVEPPAVIESTKAPEQVAQPAEVKPAIPAGPPTIVTDENDTSADSGGSVLDVLGNALRKGIIGVPDDSEQEK